MTGTPAPGTPAVVAVDVGGTLMKGAVVDIDGTLLASDCRPTPAERTPDGIVAFAADLVERAGSVVAVGVVVPGLVDEERGVARYSANLGWRDVPMRDLVRERIGLPVAIGHDVRTGGLAEGLFGAARGVPDFVFVPIGTGLAAAMFVAGRPVAGSTGMAGEIGHVPTHPDGEACACGQLGCPEAYASAAAVARRYGRLGGRPGLSTPDIVALATAGGPAGAGDPVAAGVWQDAVATLGLALATYTMLLDPALIVIGGGLADAGHALFDPLRAELKGRLAWREPPAVVPAMLGSSAGRLGAAVLAWRVAGHPEAGATWRPVSEGGP